MIQAGLSDLRQSFDVGVKVLRPLQKLFRLYPQTRTLGIRDSNKQAAYVEAVDELAHHSTVPAFVNALKWKCKAFNAMNMEDGIGFGREYCFTAAIQAGIDITADNVLLEQVQWDLLQKFQMEHFKVEKVAVEQLQQSVKPLHDTCGDSILPANKHRMGVVNNVVRAGYPGISVDAIQQSLETIKKGASQPKASVGSFDPNELYRSMNSFNSGRKILAKAAQVVATASREVRAVSTMATGTSTAASLEQKAKTLLQGRKVEDVNAVEFESFQKLLVAESGSYVVKTLEAAGVLSQNPSGEIRSEITKGCVHFAQSFSLCAWFLFQSYIQHLHGVAQEGSPTTEDANSATTLTAMLNVVDGLLKNAKSIKTNLVDAILDDGQKETMHYGEFVRTVDMFTFIYAVIDAFKCFLEARQIFTDHVPSEQGPLPQGGVQVP